MSLSLRPFLSPYTSDGNKATLRGRSGFQSQEPGLGVGHRGHSRRAGRGLKGPCSPTWTTAPTFPPLSPTAGRATLGGSGLGARSTPDKPTPPSRATGRRTHTVARLTPPGGHRPDCDPGSLPGIPSAQPGLPPGSHRGHRAQGPDHPARRPLHSQRPPARAPAPPAPGPGPRRPPVGRTRGTIWWPSSLSWLELQTCSSPAAAAAPAPPLVPQQPSLAPPVPGPSQTEA